MVVLFLFLLLLMLVIMVVLTMTKLMMTKMSLPFFTRPKKKKEISFKSIFVRCSCVEIIIVVGAYVDIISILPYLDMKRGTFLTMVS